MMQRVLTAVLLCVAALGSSAAGAEKSLLRFVAPDVAAYVHVPRLEQSVRTAWSSTLARRIRELSVYRRWLRSPGFEQMVAGRDQLTKAVGRPIEEFAADLLGREVVLAISTRKDDEPTAVTRFASNCRRPENLDAAVTGR